MSGDDGEVVTPVPIPNTEVKHFSAEDSIMDAKIGRCQAISLMNGRLAQLGEHLPYKQRVSGSSPLSPTIHSAEIAQSGRATDL